jgi:hypothetical protein
MGTTTSGYPLGRHAPGSDRRDRRDSIPRRMKPRRTDGAHARPQTQQTTTADSSSTTGTTAGGPGTERGKDTATGAGAEP